MSKFIESRTLDQLEKIAKDLSNAIEKGEVKPGNKTPIPHMIPVWTEQLELVNQAIKEKSNEINLK